MKKGQPVWRILSFKDLSFPRRRESRDPGVKHQDDINSDKQAGFSLMEAAIALSVVGVLLSIGLPLYVKYHRSACWKKTDEHLKEISYALEGYCRMNNALPFASKDDKGKAEDIRTVGYLPYRTIGVPEHIAKDGFGRTIRYALHQNLGSLENAPNWATIDELEIINDLSVRDKLNQNVSEIQIAYVLVAEGESTGDHQYERQNLKDDKLFYDHPYSENETKPFKQKLKWETYTKLSNKIGAPLKKEASQGNPYPEQQDVEDQF